MESPFLIWLTHCDRLIVCRFHCIMRSSFDADESRWRFGSSQTDRSGRPGNPFLPSHLPFNIFLFHIQLLIDLSNRVLETQVKIHTDVSISIPTKIPGKTANNSPGVQSWVAVGMPVTRHPPHRSAEIDGDVHKYINN
jgi:hypothetical protein